MWKRNLRIVKKYQWLYLTKLISVKLREAPTNKNMFKFAENTFIYSLIKTLFSSPNVQRLLVKYFPKQELTYILSSLKIHDIFLDMARYGVGKGPLCHMCVPVSLCFARADFPKILSTFSDVYGLLVSLMIVATFVHLCFLCQPFLLLS